MCSPASDTFIIHSPHFCIFFLGFFRKRNYGTTCCCWLTFILLFFSPTLGATGCHRADCPWRGSLVKTLSGRTETIKHQRPREKERETWRRKKSSVSPLFGNVNIRKCRLSLISDRWSQISSHRIGERGLAWQQLIIMFPGEHELQTEATLSVFSFFLPACRLNVNFRSKLENMLWSFFGQADGWRVAPPVRHKYSSMTHSSASLMANITLVF